MSHCASIILIAVNFYGNIVDSFVSGGKYGHTGVFVGCVSTWLSVLYCHIKENIACTL